MSNAVPESGRVARNLRALLPLLDIEFDLVHETVTWFAERGSVTARARLTVA